MSADFIKKMPKVELHAHINGSISEKTMGKLIKLKGPNGVAQNWRFMFQKGEIATLADCFNTFRLIHLISDNTEAAYMITYDVIHEFAADNVKYLELRTTPRAVEATGMTKESYIEAVLKAINDCAKIEALDITVKLLLAIDRRNPVSVAMETVQLADKYSNSGRIVGIDLSGDPAVGNAADFIPVFKEAKSRGLNLALHLAEVPAVEETLEVLQILPGRIGHGTCLHPEAGGSQALIELVDKHRIPLELCLTSNVISKTVTSFGNHQFKFWFDRGHPCIICTDDKGVFSTSLSEEYAIAEETFNLTKETLYNLSLRSIDYIFADETVKQMLRQKWSDFKEINYC